MGGRGEGLAGESGLWLPEDDDGEVVWVQKTGQNSLWCGPLGTLLCHSCAPRAREVKQCIPTPRKASDTTGLPQTARAGLLFPQRLPDPEATPLGTVRAVGVMHNSSQEQDGENQCPVSCR